MGRLGGSVRPTEAQQPCTSSWRDDSNCELRAVEAEEVFARLRAMNHTPQLGDLAPTPIREVLTRCCRNLANHFTAAQDHDRARLYAGFVADFEAVHERSAQP